MMNRIKYLDGIKGLGALFVFFCHFNLLQFPSPNWFHSGIFSKWCASGGFAVALFIIISGFLAFNSVQRKLNNDLSISKVVINRYFRFAVPFGIAFIILYITNIFGLYSYHTEAGQILKSEPLTTAFWQVNIVGFCKSLLLSPFNPDFWDAPLWMMKYVFFSTYIALIIAIGIKKLNFIKSIAIVLFTLVFLSFLDIFYYGVVIGILLSILYINERQKQDAIDSKSSSNYLGVVCLIICILCRYFLPGSAEFVNFTSAAFLLLAIYYLRIVQKVLETSVFQFLGKISFGIFIWHWPILCSLTSFLFVKNQGMDSITCFLITFIPTLLVVLICAYLSEKYIETKLSNYIINKINLILYNE